MSVMPKSEALLAISPDPENPETHSATEAYISENESICVEHFCQFYVDAVLLLKMVKLVSDAGDKQPY